MIFEISTQSDTNAEIIGAGRAAALKGACGAGVLSGTLGGAQIESDLRAAAG
jgi:hypothetical protein